MFKLYPGEEKLTLRYTDYAAIMEQASDAKRVLEIGPGISTFALLEAGVEEIVTLEHDPTWYDKAVEDFKEYPQVKVGRYQDLPVATCDLAPDEQFDLALVDSPKGFTKPVLNVEGVRVAHPGMEDCSRLNTCILALKHAPVVLLHDAYRPLERATVGRLSAMGHDCWFVGNSRCGIARIIRNGKDASGPRKPGTIQSGRPSSGAGRWIGGI